MTEHRAVTAHCTRSGRWVAVSVPALSLHTQARDMDSVPATVVDAARLLGVDLAETDVACVVDR